MSGGRQPKLFSEQNVPWQDEETGVYASVVFNRPLRTAFSYSVPADLVDQIAPGKRINAPFGRGNHRTTGYCVDVQTTRPHADRLKPIQAVLDEEPLLSPAMLELTHWIADRYFCGWGQVLDGVLPRAVKIKSGSRWEILLQPVSASSETAASDGEIGPPAEPSKEPPAARPPLTSKQKRAWQVLIEFGRPASIKEVGNTARCGPDCVKALIEKGYVTTLRQRVYPRMPRLAPVLWDRPLTLNPDQQQAKDRITAAIDEYRSQAFLLHGVTGSGKTEVYLQAIAEVIKHGREAIVLVPEISLTPQTIQRFRQRFDHVAVLHSHLSDVDRHWYWQRILAGEVQVIVGARSALFAPCQHLGLIVIDEEHETTFKQESTPRYHAREVALERGRLENVPVVLGSATPSLETWHASLKGKIELLSLPNRVAELPMPKVGIVDLRQEYRQKGAMRSLSRPLQEGVRKTVEAGGQVILLLNRRGFSTALLCPQCGHVETCQHCDIALTYHKGVECLLCHSCDSEFPIPQQCRKCRAPAIRYSGVGTQRLEEEVRTTFPEMTVARMDSDTMRSAAHYEKVLESFRKGETQILLGTQMIAKGLDFPNVHLVGVITADTARHLPDFRASERTFQLIAQVAGRTGRGETPGRVLVQTFNPDDPAILAAAQHDYHRFVQRELPLRREFGYPPANYLTRVIVRATSEEVARQASNLLADAFRAQLPHIARPEVAPGQDDFLAEIRTLGPAAAPVPKLRDLYRMHFQIHTPDHQSRFELLERSLAQVELPGDAEYVVDVDPVSLI